MSQQSGVQGGAAVPDGWIGLQMLQSQSSQDLLRGSKLSLCQMCRI